MKNASKWIWILAGILLILFGIFRENLYANGTVSVTATITRVQSETDNMSDISDEYTVYFGKYTLNGKEYTNMQLDSHGGRAKYEVGETMTIQVDGTGEAADSGAGLILMGGIFLLLGIGDLRKERKAAAQAEK